MKKQEKVTVVEDLKNQILARSSIILTDFTGINVKNITALRRNLGEKSCSLRVVKNTLLRRAASGSPLEELVRDIEGPTALVISDDAAIGAKALIEFAKKDDKPRIKGAWIEGEIVTPDKLKSIAVLPPRPVLLAMAMSGMKAPLTHAAGLMRGVLSKFLLTLHAVAEAKEKEGSEPLNDGGS
jgi:large subunit ribosomal protein L10